MRTHSLYLSTLTGQVATATFLATTPGGVQLSVQAVYSGTIAVGQTIFTHGYVNTIASLGTGTGGAGSYNLSIPVANTGGTGYTYFSYTPNTAKKNAPTLKQNLNFVKWQINWDEIFGDKTGECRARILLKSNASPIFNNYNVNNGSVRASFVSNSSYVSNGLNIGDIQLQMDLIGVSYLNCDTTSTNGITMVIPKSSNEFSLSILNITETPMLYVQEYQVWLYFDVDE